MPHMPCFPNMVSLRVKLRREENQEEEEGMVPEENCFNHYNARKCNQRGAEHDR